MITNTATRRPAVALAALVLAVTAGVVGATRAAAAGSAGSAAPAAPGGARPPVVVLVLDELGTGSLMTARGRIDTQRFPNFAALARTATWYRNNSTVADATRSAVPAILTGRRPGAGESRVAGRPRSIFTMLRGRYRLRGYESVTELCPRSWCPAPKPGARLAGARLDARARQGAHLGMVAGSLRQLEAGRLPLAWVTHVILPHVPWRYLPTGESYDDSSLPFPALSLVDGADYWTASEYGIALNQQRALLQVGFVDRVVGEVRRRLQRAGLWRKAMVVVVADHGSAFTAGAPRRTLTPETFGQVAMVPLLVKYPGQSAGRISDRSTNSSEVLATVARWTGSGLAYRGATLDEAPYGRDVVTRVARRDANLRMPLADAVAQRSAAIAQRDRRLPWASLYRTPTNQGLVGRRPNDAERAARAAGLVRVGGWFASPARRVRPGSLNGSYLTARVSGLEEGDRVAVALNGTVAAVSEVFASRQSPGSSAVSRRIATMIDPRYLRRGPLRLSFYRVEGARLYRLRSG